MSNWSKTPDERGLGARVAALIAEAFRLADAGRYNEAGACFAEADTAIARHELAVDRFGRTMDTGARKG